MEVKVKYSINQLEDAVSYVAKNNTYFFGRNDYIRERIQDHIEQIAHILPNDLYFIGTMGYFVVATSIEKEGIDHDENIIHIEFWVDPGLGRDYDAEEGQSSAVEHTYTFSDKEKE